MDISSFLWICLLIYLAAFTILFIFPTLIHQKRDFALSKRIIALKRMAAFSHRGGQKENFENSISAFRHSIKLGYFGLELDVFRSKCGKLVVAHDENLIRSTGQDTHISDIDYKDIGPYKETIHDSWSDETDVFTNPDQERPPLLEDLCKLVKDESVMLNIDLKSNDVDDFGRICEMLVKYKLEKRAVIGGFASDACKAKMRQMSCKIPMFFDVRDCAIFFNATFLGMLPFFTFKNDWIEVPHAFRHYFESSLHKEYFLARVVGYIFWIESFYFRLVVWHMNRRGIPVVFWVLNCEEDWNKGISMGANGLMTDYPKRMKEFLVSKGLFDN